MNSKMVTARTAGFIYLVVVIFGLFSLMYIPNTLIVWGDAGATASKIMQSELLFRFGIVSGFICMFAFILLPLVLYKLLKETNNTYALLMVIFALLSAPISFLNLSNQFSMLQLISGADYLQVFEVEQLYALMMLSLDSYFIGDLIAQIFWGAWLLPFGILVYKSGFLPRILGVFLMIACFCYLIDSIGPTLFADYWKTIIAKNILMPAGVAEIGICLWLLIRGIDQTKIDIEPG